MSKVYKDEQTQEWYFSDDSYILSETDSKGIILYANEIFYEIAGYTPNELEGEPHNIIRHSDMPRIAFKGFWTGVVKNLRKDGGYYWVHATVLRQTKSNGDVTYLSIRRVPSRSDVEACTTLYAELKSAE